MHEPKLSIEAIPESLWGLNLPDKLGQSHWNRLRKACYARAGHVCEVCHGIGSRHPVECHEIWVYDDVKHIQKLMGLIALCPACHLVKHYGRACAIGHEDDARKHLEKTNGWSAVQAETYISEMRELWERRSEFDWTQNLTWLVKNG
jgi:hypothetical protein